jgi:hypothetical protein
MLINTCEQPKKHNKDNALTACEESVYLLFQALYLLDFLQAAKSP